LDDIETELRALLLLGLDGDNRAYREFLTRSGSRLRSYFRRRLSAFADDVEDLVQDTLLAVHNQRHTYRQAERVTPWLHAIARYKMIDLLRARMPRRAVEVTLDDDSAEAALNREDADAAESRHDLLQLLALLPERYRRPIVAVKLEGRSIAECASETGLSESAVKVGIHRGLKRLAAHVGRRG
jgi:RNA polymerase sigma-70 factor (ECF subfamily)